MQAQHAPLAPECQENNDEPTTFGLGGKLTHPIAPPLDQRELALLLFALEGTTGGRNGATVH